MVLHFLVAYERDSSYNRGSNTRLCELLEIAAERLGVKGLKYVICVHLSSATLRTPAIVHLSANSVDYGMKVGSIDPQPTNTW